MCSTPISVPNPLFNRSGFCSEYGSICEISSHFSPSSKFIEVPCGKCAECRDTYYVSILQRAICESLSSYLYFVTLTYDDSHIPYLDLDNERILYADYSNVQDMIKRFRASRLLDRDFRYLVVNEYGDRYFRPHIHLLFFVAKRDNDTSLIPYDIERILYDNLKLYWSINVGSRKHPVYEPLFTFAQRVSIGGRIMSNYWVKYVEPKTEYDSLKELDDSSNIRAIRYLIGYVNKSTRLDSFVSNVLSNHLNDSKLCFKIKSILSNRVRYSKGFGCGFIDGVKYVLPKISVRASSNILVYNEIVHNLPDKVDDFIDLYPELYERLLIWQRSDIYSRYDSLESAIKSFTVDDYYFHCLNLRYFPNYFNYHYNQLYKPLLEPTISLFFTVNDSLHYGLKQICTHRPVNSPLYQFLRDGVEKGIKAALPFIAFPLQSTQGYVPLCKFYRERVCTFDDLQRMYDSLGVRNYDEWMKYFIKSYNTRKADKSLGNELKYKEKSEFILHNQKKSLHLLRRNQLDCYSTLLVH